MMALPRPEGHAVRLNFRREGASVIYLGMEKTPKLLPPRPSQGLNDPEPDAASVLGSWYITRDEGGRPLFITTAHDPAHVLLDIPPAPDEVQESADPAALVVHGPVSFELYIPNDDQAATVELFSTEFRDALSGQEDALVGKFNLTWEVS
jgi:hypothetical protein